jgi:hypothetical protein
LALPLKFGMVCVSSRRFSAVMSWLIGFVGIVEFRYGFEILVFKGDCYIKFGILVNPISWFFF